ncbi:hypothetical protein DNTS_021893 [Danionella cerebrum]|uniref:Uncharacterized protein n=1 Tax=Danionella cerebrum TaxID=2873325 RepID=A0A553QK86_9TELE|nr:hypothetical protein DNTS_021893 [Danionella translucida]
MFQNSNLNVVEANITLVQSSGSELGMFSSEQLRIAGSSISIALQLCPLEKTFSFLFLLLFKISEPSQSPTDQTQRLSLKEQTRLC